MAAAYVRVQYTGQTVGYFKDRGVTPDKIPEGQWHNDNVWYWDGTEVDRNRMMEWLRSYLGMVFQFNCGFSHAYVRVVVEYEDDDTVLPTTKGPISLRGPRVIFGPEEQTGERPDLDRPPVPPSLPGDAPPPPPDPLRVLDKEPASAGTVIEILDEWGDPIGATEVS